MQNRSTLARNIRAAQARARREQLAELDTTGLSARNLALLTRGVSGGADPEPTVEELLAEVEKVDELEDEAIATLIDDLVTAGVGLADDPTDENLLLGDKVLEAKAKLEGVQDARETAATERATKAEELRKKLKGEDAEPAPDPEADPDPEEEDDPEAEPEADPEAEPEADPEAESDPPAEVEDDEEKIAASKARITRVRARKPESMNPRPRATKTDRRLKLVAAGNVPGVTAGEVLDTPEKISAAFGEAIMLAQDWRGGREKLRVARLGVYDAADIYGEERTLRWDARTNDQRIAALNSPEAIKAAGGKCAPSPIDYTQAVLGTEDRPVWNDTLARLGADRGGVRTLPLPTLADVSSGIDAWTEENDQDPSDPATKPCVVMTCPDDVETIVEALTKCIQVGNFRQRYWPEQVEAWVKKAGVQAARFAESRHLTRMGALSTNVTVDKVLGTTRDVLAALDRAAAAQRNHFRFDLNMPFHFTAPAWLLPNMITDLSREMPGATAERLATSEATLAEFFRVRNINTTWSLDGEAGQIFGAQADGLLNKWPSVAIGYFHPEGTMLGLDGGSLDFGVVRDSTLNSTNDLQIFSESFEAVHFHGDGQPLRMQIEICADGQTSNGIDLDVCTTGS